MTTKSNSIHDTYLLAGYGALTITAYIVQKQIAEYQMIKNERDTKLGLIANRQTNK